MVSTVGGVARVEVCLKIDHWRVTTVDIRLSREGSAMNMRVLHLATRPRLPPSARTSDIEQLAYPAGGET